MHGKIGWAGDTPDLLFATFGEDWAGNKHHMVVEAIPGGGWDWVAWANDGSGRSVHGTSSCRKAAMRAAEQATILLRCRSVSPGPVAHVTH